MSLRMMCGCSSPGMSNHLVKSILHVALICRVPHWNVLQKRVKETSNIAKHVVFVCACNQVTMRLVW